MLSRREEEPPPPPHHFSPFPSLHSFLIHGLSIRHKIQGLFDRSFDSQAGHYRCVPPWLAQNAPFKHLLSLGTLYNSPPVLEEMPFLPVLLAQDPLPPPSHVSLTPSSVLCSAFTFFFLFTKDTHAVPAFTTVSHPIHLSSFSHLLFNDALPSVSPGE